MTAVAEIEQVALEESTDESDGQLHQHCCRNSEVALCGTELYAEEVEGEVTCPSCRYLIERGEFHEVIYAHRHCPLDETGATICPRRQT